MSGLFHTLEGLVRRDFILEPWLEGHRLLNSMLEQLDEKLKLEKVFHLIDKMSYPSPEYPTMAFRLKESDKLAEEKAHDEFQENQVNIAAWERDYGQTFRYLRQVRQQQHLSHHDEDVYWTCENFRPRQRKAKFIEPIYRMKSFHAKEIIDYPINCKKEEEDSITFQRTLCLFLAPIRVQEYRLKLFDNGLLRDSTRDRAIAAYFHLIEMRQTPDPAAQQSIENDFINIPAISTFEQANTACAYATKLQQELSWIGDGEFQKSDDYLIRSIIKHFDLHSQQLQLFIVNNSLGEASLATKSVEIKSLSARRQQPARLTSAIIRMSWIEFCSKIAQLGIILSGSRHPSIYRATIVPQHQANSTIVTGYASAHTLDHQQRGDERRSYQEERDRERGRRSQSTERNGNRGGQFSREGSRSRDRRTEKPGNTPGPSPKVDLYPNWHNRPTAQTRPKPRGTPREFVNRAYSASEGHRRPTVRATSTVSRQRQQPVSNVR